MMAKVLFYKIIQSGQFIVNTYKTLFEEQNGKWFVDTPDFLRFTDEEWWNTASAIYDNTEDTLYKILFDALQKRIPPRTLYFERDILSYSRRLTFTSEKKEQYFIRKRANEKKLITIASDLGLIAVYSLPSLQSKKYPINIKEPGIVFANHDYVVVNSNEKNILEILDLKTGQTEEPYKTLYTDAQKKILEENRDMFQQGDSLQFISLTGDEFVFEASYAAVLPRDWKILRLGNCEGIRFPDPGLGH